jgi:hypothetical protein
LHGSSLPGDDDLRGYLAAASDHANARCTRFSETRATTTTAAGAETTAATPTATKVAASPATASAIDAGRTRTAAVPASAERAVSSGTAERAAGDPDSASAANSAGVLGSSGATIPACVPAARVGAAAFMAVDTTETAADGAATALKTVEAVTTTTASTTGNDNSVR